MAKDRKRHVRNPPTRIDEAAGGAIVARQDGGLSVVLIATEKYGQRRWSLPKGHLKKGETREQAAVREVREETGLDVQILAPLGTIDYWFTEGKFRYHKFVHFYLMRELGGRLGDHDDEVVEARRLAWEEALRHMAYSTERDLLAAAAATVLDLLPGEGGGS